MLSPYFLQTPAWANFWQEANGVGHTTQFFEHVTAEFTISTYVYEYPWAFGQKFWYIPEGPILNQLLEERVNLQVNLNILHTHIEQLVSKIAIQAESNDIAFVKIDIDSTIADLFNIHTLDHAYSFWQSIASSISEIKFTQKSSRRIMYNATIVLDVHKLVPTNLKDTGFATSALTYFYDTNKNFWGQVNAHTRSRTKKSLLQNWEVDSTKNEANFEEFWEISQATASRQNFSTQPKSYFHALFQKPESRILILRNAEGRSQSVWFGYSYNDSIVYLYGGNTGESMEKFGQYLIHLSALKMAQIEQKSWYDLGGYSPDEGYGVFKERYKGQLVNFPGPVDLVVKSNTYRLINNVIRVRKFIKKTIRI